MGHRINERNSGHSRLDGGAKARPCRGVSLRGEQRTNTLAILGKVFAVMERDDVMEGFTDGGRFTLCLDRHEMAVLSETIEKLKGDDC